MASLDADRRESMARERAADIRGRLRADMTTTLTAWEVEHVDMNLMVDDLVDDAMHHVEHLIAEVTW